MPSNNPCVHGFAYNFDIVTDILSPHPAGGKIGDIIPWQTMQYLVNTSFADLLHLLLGCANVSMFLPVFSLALHTAVGYLMAPALSQGGEILLASFTFA